MRSWVRSGAACPFDRPAAVRGVHHVAGPAAERAGSGVGQVYDAQVGRVHRYVVQDHRRVAAGHGRPALAPRARGRAGHAGAAGSTSGSRPAYQPRAGRQTTAVRTRAASVSGVRPNRAASARDHTPHRATPARSIHQMPRECAPCGQGSTGLTKPGTAFTSGHCPEAPPTRARHREPVQDTGSARRLWIDASRHALDATPPSARRHAGLAGPTSGGPDPPSVVGQDRLSWVRWLRRSGGSR